MLFDHARNVGLRTAPAVRNERLAFAEGRPETSGGATFYAGRDGYPDATPRPGPIAASSATCRGVLFRMSDEVQAPTAQSTKRRGGQVRGCLIEIVETILLTAIIFFLVQHFVAQPYQIQGISMENTLHQDQMVLVDKISPVFTDYRRGDVIVFEPPAGHLEDGKDVPFIKRVIGIGGDVVQIHDGSVFVNGAKLVEPNVFTDDGLGTQLSANDMMDASVIASHVCDWSETELTCRIPAGDLFVLGAHRNQSTDSRVFGPIQKSTVIGRAWLRYWPMADLGWVQPVQYSNVPNSPPASLTGPAASATPAPTASPKPSK